MKRLGIVKNPLSVIGIFAGISEIGGTAILPFISDENQTLYIWFLMLFPVSLTTLFFATLNWNPKVLYAPSDFQSDESFLRNTNRYSPENLEIRQQELKNMSHFLEEKVRDILSSKLEHSDSLSNQQLIETLTNSIKNTTSIVIDAREFLGNNEKIMEIPFLSITSFGELTDEIYYFLDSKVKPFEYGYSWIVEDLETGKTLKNARMITGELPGIPVLDNRSLSEVNITPGSTLIIKRPKKETTSSAYRQ